MFGLTKREQRWKAEQRAAEVVLPFLAAVVRAEADARIVEAQAVAVPADQWFCEYHPEHAMGHEGCTGPGIPESARIHMLTNKIRLLEQEVREAGLMRDEMAAAARRAAALAASPVVHPAGERTASSEGTREAHAGYSARPDEQDAALASLRPPVEKP